MKSLIAFCAVFCGFAVIAWLAGYNFDERNPLVALWFTGAMFVATIAAAAIEDLER